MVDWKIKTLLQFFTTLRLFANAAHLPVVKLIHAYNLQQSKTMAASKDPIHTKTVQDLNPNIFSRRNANIQKTVPMIIFIDEGLKRALLKYEHLFCPLSTYWSVECFSKHPADHLLLWIEFCGTFYHSLGANRHSWWTYPFINRGKGLGPNGHGGLNRKRD